MRFSQRRLAGIVVFVPWIAALVAVPTGCDDAAEGTASVSTRDPVAAFAPLVLLHPRERLLPQSAERYLEHASLWWAEDWACPHERIAPSRTAVRAGARGNPLQPRALGAGRLYERAWVADDCTPSSRRRLVPSDLTRPQHSGPGRVPWLGEREGFHLQPDRAAPRSGPPLDTRNVVSPAVPAYFDTRRERVDGGPGLRIAYWLFYPASGSVWLEWWKNDERRRTWGRDQIGRGGDWQRVDVLLRRAGASRYEPVALRLYAHDGERDLPWDEVDRAAVTHPIVFAALGSHAPYARAGFHETSTRRPTGNYSIVDDAATCRGCPRWRTWRRLVDARHEPWYGYGGAWGPEGGSSATTGSLGPRPPEAEGPEPTLAARTADPAAAFAPLVRFDPHERRLPLSAHEFIAKSTLHWAHASSACGYGTSASGSVAIAKTPQDVPVTDAARLGDSTTAAPYLHRQARWRGCAPVGRPYTAGELTRPFERPGRPRGLRPAEGFYLDLLTDAKAGARLAPGAKPRVRGVPVYVERSPVAAVPGRWERFTYWMLFGSEEQAGGGRRTPADGDDPVEREGGWERFEVLAEGQGGGAWQPLAVRHGDGPELPWSAVTLADGHPVIDLERGSHTPRPASASSCRPCPIWQTWRAVRSAPAERWYGYGGAWGTSGDDSRTTGPLGPGARP